MEDLHVTEPLFLMVFPDSWRPKTRIGSSLPPGGAGALCTMPAAAVGEGVALEILLEPLRKEAKPTRCPASGLSLFAHGLNAAPHVGLGVM